MFFTKTLRSKSFLRNRLAIARGFLSAFSFTETVALLLPDRLSPSRTGLVPRYLDFLKERSEKEIMSAMGEDYPEILKQIEGDSRLLLMYEVMVADQYCAKKFLKKDSVVIDAGANIGVFSVFASLLAPRGQVYAFEPVKKTYEVLKKNTAAFPCITALHQGLGKEEKMEEILTSSGSAGMSALADSELAVKNKRFFNGTEKVEITTLDRAMEKENIPRVDFIKIDTEGYEAQVLEGARRTIQKWKPIIAMSAYHNKNDKHDLPKLLKEICGEYVSKLHKDAEEDMICYVKK